MKKLVGFVVSLALALVIILTLNESALFPAFGEVDLAERISSQYFNLAQFEAVGSANIVTAILAGYRGLDTLGEVTVLFISSIGVAFIMAEQTRKRIELDYKANFMLRTGSRLIVSLILVTSFYIILHGHLSPGGGFPGGTMIASAILLLYLADEEFRSNIRGFKILESLAGTFIVVTGLLGLIFASAFLENFLPSGTIGELVSGGIIPIIYILIGLKVGSEISGIIDHFLSEEETV
jgi:multicomponent Na+:H+ antiporter subunit B